MAPRKTTRKAGEKAGRKPGTFRKGDPRINRTKPGPGRPPDEFRQICRRLASRKATVVQIEKILTDGDHPHFMKALAWAADRGFGRAAAPIEISGGDDNGVQVDSRLTVEWGDLKIPL